MKNENFTAAINKRGKMMISHGFEKNTRASIAVSMLNRLRHWLMEKSSKKPNENDFNVLIESLDINKSENIPQKIIYGFQSYSNKERAVALQISDAFVKAQKEGFFQDTNWEQSIRENIHALKSDLNLTCEKKQFLTSVLGKLILSITNEINYSMEASVEEY
jgi:hypothetical protein